MPQLRPRLIALTRLHKACNRQKIRSPQPQMAPTHKGRTRIKARVKAGKARDSRGKDRATGKVKYRAVVVAMAVEEEEIIPAASQGKMSRSLCQGRLVLVAAHKAIMATTVSSRTAVLSPTRRSLNGTSK